MVTPIDRQLEIDADRLAAFGARLLARGMNGLVPFGTMGEGPAFSAAQRLAAVARLVESGLAADRIILGIGGGGLADQAWLGRRAGELGIAGVLATPPFFFRDVDQDGVHAFYASLVEALGPEAPPLLLYHIPQVCGVPVAIETAARLVDDFPGRIGGIKDSGADLEHTLALLAAIGDRAAVLVGAERHLPEAMPAGARGTICGLANLVPAAVCDLVAGGTDGLAAVSGCATALAGVPVIPTVKAAVGLALGEPGWSACMPPLRASADRRAERLAALTSL
ncbi:MAG: dihydrodipicolinate synthase family protein [Geminicoccaceae bacterium]